MDSAPVQEAEGIQKIEFRAMGSQMLAAVRSNSQEARGVLAQVPAWFEGWEQTLSRFRQDSELSRLNRASGSDTPTPVSDTLWAVLQTALQAAHATGGLISPTVLNALVAAGYDATFEAVKDGQREAAGIAQAPNPNPDWRGIKTYPETRAVLLPAGVRLDFGGIAKGWAADRAAERLSAYGPALVDAGGDIAVRGHATEHHEWPIGIDAPTFPGFAPGEQLDLVAIISGGVATSGRDYRRWQQDGRWRHHIIDPRTGLPAETDVVAATVVAPGAGEAEIAAKVAMLMGSSQGLEWLEARPTLAGLLVLEDGRVLRSKRLGNYLWSSLHAN